MSEVNKYFLVFSLFFGCVAGLDNHLGDHFVSMRICTFYPVFLAGYYYSNIVRKVEHLSGLYNYVLKICSFLFMNVCLLLSIQKVDALYPFIKLLKGKYTYQEMNLGIKGMVARLICYGLWILMIAAVILINSNKEHIYTWLGKRTLSVFVWHNLIVVILFKVIGLKNIMKNILPHYYLFAAICVAIIISIVTAYLPEIRVPTKSEIVPGKQKHEYHDNQLES